MCDMTIQCLLVYIVYITQCNVSFLYIFAEVNQSLCSQLLPAALSVLNHVPLKTDTLRPVVTLIASCVSNNGMFILTRRLYSSSFACVESAETVESLSLILAIHLSLSHTYTHSFYSESSQTHWWITDISNCTETTDAPSNGSTN